MYGSTFEGIKLSLNRDLIESRIQDIRSAILSIQDICKKRHEELESRDVYAIRYLIITIVESLVSISLHILAEVYSIFPKSYRDAIEILAEKLELNKRCIEDLKALIGLRNLLVHWYWTINDREIYDSIVNDFHCVYSFIESIEREIL